MDSSRHGKQLLQCCCGAAVPTGVRRTTWLERGCPRKTLNEQSGRVGTPLSSAYNSLSCGACALFGSWVDPR